MPAGDNFWGMTMPSQWFSNRGQMIQAICAVLAVLIGIAAQWNQLSVAVNLGEILKVLFYPIAVLIGFQLGKRAVRPSAQTAASSPTTKEFPDIQSMLGPELNYKFLSPAIKVGSYFDVGEEFALRRVSAV